MLETNIIGAGRLGKTLAHLLQKKGLIKVNGVYNQSPKSAFAAIDFIEQGICFNKLKDLPAADLTLITVPDYCIQSICESLAAHEVLKVNSIVLHCSGVLSSDVLSAAKSLGCLTASVHPMRSFADPFISVNEYAGTYCAIEGNTEAVRKIKILFEAIGSKMIPIDKDKKNLYHAAAVFASNYMVTLAYAAQKCLKDAGIQEDTARRMTSMLMRSTEANLASMSPEEALTGPLMRGDFSTITSHLKALADSPLKDCYVQLALLTLPWIDLPSEQRRYLEELLVGV